MKITFTLSPESASEVTAIQSMLASFSASAGISPVIVGALAKRGRGRPPKQAEPVTPPVDDAEIADEPAIEEGEAEVVTKDMVADKLRAFIRDKGKEGPALALGALQKFGAAKFDKLDPAKFSAFLSYISTL